MLIVWMAVRRVGMAPILLAIRGMLPGVRIFSRRQSDRVYMDIHNRRAGNV